MVLVGFVPTGNEIAAGDTERVKFGSAVTVSVMAAVSTVDPLVPVIVTVAAPTVAVAVAVKVSVLPAEPVIEAGLKLAVTPAGRPLTVKATALSKPLIAETMTLLVAVVPCMTVVPEPETVKPAAVVAGTTGFAFCTFIANSVIQKVPAGGESASESVSPPANELVFAGLQLGSPPVSVVPLYTLPG